MEFSNRWAGVSTDQFIAAAEKIKGGYAKLSGEALAGVNRVAQITGRGLKGAPAEMAEFYGKAFNIHRKFYQKMDDLKFAEMISGGMAAAYENFDTNASKMAVAMATLGAEAANLKVPLQEQIAVLGMLTNKLKSPEEAAEAYKGVMANLVKAQKNLNKGMEIGGKEYAFTINGKPIKFVDEKGNAKSLAFVLDAIKAIQSRAKGLGLDLGEVNDALVAAFGSETARKVLTNLINDTGEMRRMTKEVKKSMDQGLGPAIEKANMRNKGFGERLQKITQRLNNVAAVIGKALNPAMEKLDKLTTKYLEPLQKWIDNNPVLVSQLSQVAMALGTVFVGVGVLTQVFKLLGLAVWLNPLTWKIMAVAAVIGSLIYVVYSFYDDWRPPGISGGIISSAWCGAMVAASVFLGPVVGGILAIGGILVAVVGYVINHWSELVSFFERLADQLKPIWDEWGDYLIAVLAGAAFLFNPILGAAVAAVGFIINHWSELGEFFTGLGQRISDVASIIRDTVVGAWEDPLGTLQALWDGLLNYIEKKIGSFFSSILGTMGRLHAWWNDDETPQSKEQEVQITLPKLTDLLKGLGSRIGELVDQWDFHWPENTSISGSLTAFGQAFLSGLDEWWNKKPGDSRITEYVTTRRKVKVSTEVETNSTEKAGAWWGKRLEGIKAFGRAFEAASKGIRTAFSKSSEAIWQSIEALWTKAGEKFRSFKKQAAESLEGIRTALIKASEAIWQSIEALWTKRVISSGHLKSRLPSI
jgi:TP901 family phage tail tape measure protein